MTSTPSLTNLNRARIDPRDSSWNSVLNTSKRTSTPELDPFMGVTEHRTLTNAKLSDSTLNLAKSTFAKALNEASDSRKSLGPDQEEKLKQTAETLVNQFFMGSMLKQMRNSPFKNEMFTGGKGGDAYAGLFDQHLSEHAGSGVAKDLVKSMVKQYARTAQGVNAAADVGGGVS